MKKLNQIPVVSGHPVFPLHFETKNSILAFSAIRLIRPFPMKRTANRKTSGRKERTNRDQNRRFPERSRVVLALPRGWRARENLTKTPSKRATNEGRLDDIGGKRLGKTVREEGKGMRGPISLRIEAEGMRRVFVSGG